MLVTVGLFTWVLGSYLTGTAATAVVWATAVIGAIAFCAAPLAHEPAHSIVARRSGVRVDVPGPPARPGPDPPPVREGPQQRHVTSALIPYETAGDSP
ncbi:hypothetical protein IU427_33590 [Nocardia beijingensis]|uniref:hypothetical protein n=1 Tax=Nocardia beijingensis TaxID=95162 RepID=UPI001892F571|nr:hypothetical protein [Nocardia beijingensis]MBF6470050.1 hypothetical protein [Nocardia beijingensis]